MQMENVKVNKIYQIETSKLGHAFQELGKSVLIHVKNNKKVYMQIGKVAFYGVITATGLFITDTQVFASTWSDDLNAKAEHLYTGLVQLCGWIILGKAVWDMAVAVVNGEVKKAPSIGISYLIILGVLYALPFGMAAVKSLFVI